MGTLGNAEDSGTPQSVLVNFKNSATVDADVRPVTTKMSEKKNSEYN